MLLALISITSNLIHLLYVRLILIIEYFINIPQLLIVVILFIAIVIILIVSHFKWCACLRLSDELNGFFTKINKKQSEVA